MKPHKLNQETIEVLCRELRLGLPKHEACPLVGINRRTLQRWRKRFSWVNDAVVKAEEDGREKSQYRFWLRHHNRGKRYWKGWDPNKTPKYRAPSFRKQFKAIHGVPFTTLVKKLRGA